MVNILKKIKYRYSSAALKSEKGDDQENKYLIFIQK